MARSQFAGALVAVTLALATPFAADTPREWTPDATFLVKRVTSVEVSPDAKAVAFVVATPVMEGETSEWLSQIHVAAADGTSARQLTRSDTSATSPQWSPDGRWIAFLSSRNAKPKAVNLFRIRTDGGEAEQLTDVKGRITAARWSPDGRHVAFLMVDAQSDEEEKAAKEKRDARVVDADYKFAHLYVVPVDASGDGTRTVRALTSGATHVTDLDWSPAGTHIAIAHQPTPKVFDQNDVSLVEVASAERRALAATPADEAAPFFSPDGALVAYSASDNPPTWGFTSRVHVVASTGGASRALASTPDEQPQIVAWSADGRRVYFQEVVGTSGALFALPADGGRAVRLSAPSLNLGGASVNRGATATGFVHSWSDRPVEAFVSPLDRFEARQVSRVQDLPALPVGRTEEITWKAPDGLAIEGLLTYPVGYEAGRRVPLLVIVHGGPAGVFTHSFTGLPTPYPVSVFAARGYAVLRCNVRGSSGYGRTFRYANYRDWGGGDYRDIMSGVDHVIALGVADPERLGVMGWSYGGFMTSWIITQTKRFKAASVGAGVTNLMSFTGTADIPAFVPDYMGGEFWDVFDRWRAHSAMFNIKGVTTPTLIQHGENDLRVPISQGYELYTALVRQKVTTTMVVYPRQPHGIQEPKLMKDAMERNLEWFDRWVLRKTGTSTY
ncbi:MAG: S9 family peptidase [Vicinamibacterales bacterium]